ncbi:MAG: carboxypeptidase-like regulatory domain-containing protein [Flavobacteriales bacterium]|nr:carboxypeptidase-like regulatory domain-containing protein [Flavobacteriales bacterium]
MVLGQTGTIVGVVKNDQGYYVNNANVSIPKTKIGTTTDEKGNFTLVVPANIEHHLIISSAEFEPFEEDVIVGNGESIKILAILSTRMLKDFTTVAKDPGTSGMQLYKPVKAENISLPVPNLENQLRFIGVGVTQNNELSAGYNVRGGNFLENLIYLNGIEIYRPFLARSGQQEGLSFINPYMVDNIMFSAGGFDARYGDKLSSVLDVYYNDPKEFKATAVTSLLGASVYFQDRPSVKTNYLFGARYQTNAYLFGALDTKGEYKPAFLDVQGMMNHYITENLRLTVFASYADNKYRVVPENRETNWGSINEALRFTVYYEGQEITQFRTFIGAASIQQNALRDKLKLFYTTSVFKTVETEHFDVLGEYKLDELERDLGSDDFGEVAYTRGVGGYLEHARNNLDAIVANAYHRGELDWGNDYKNKLKWGFKYQHEEINDELSEWYMLDSARFNAPHPQDSVGYVDPNAQAYQELNLSYSLKSKNQLSSNRATGFIQNRKSWEIKTTAHFQDTILVNDTTLAFIDSTFETSKYVNATIGVRAHYWDYNGQTVFSPRASINYRPALFFKHNNQIYRRNVTFRFATGYYYQPPFYREIRNLQGEINPEIRAQKSIHFIFGTDYTFFMWDREFKFTGEAYYKYLTDLIPYEIDNVRTRYFGENNAKGYATGLDFKINGQFVKGIESYASLSFLRTREDILDDYYYEYYNSDGKKIVPGYTANNVAVDSQKIEPGYIPRPTDQFASFSLFFQDKMPEEWDTEKVKWSTFKVNLTLMFGTRLPYGPPGDERYNDTIRGSLFRRVDIGFSKDIIGPHTDRTKFGKKSILNGIDNMWISLEVFNLLDIVNSTNYNWITDVSGRKYSIPNTLTSRRINLKLVVLF